MIAGETVTFRFQLPPQLRLCVGQGRFVPCLHQARVDVGEESWVEIRSFNGSLAFARRIAFDQATRFLTTIAGGRARLPAATVPAFLRYASRPDHAERFAIVTGSSVVITRAIETPYLADVG